MFYILLTVCLDQSNQSASASASYRSVKQAAAEEEEEEIVTTVKLRDFEKIKFLMVLMVC